VGKIWRKNKMKKRLKINLLLDAQSWLLRDVQGVHLMAEFEWVFGEVASEIWVVGKLRK